MRAAPLRDKVPERLKVAARDDSWADEWDPVEAAGASDEEDSDAEDSDADGGAKRGRVTAHYIVQRSSGLEEDEGRCTRALAGRYFPLVALRCRRSSFDLCLRLPIILSLRAFVPFLVTPPNYTTPLIARSRRRHGASLLRARLRRSTLAS